jgi:hypothetical protein
LSPRPKKASSSPRRDACSACGVSRPSAYARDVRSSAKTLPPLRCDQRSDSEGASVARSVSAAVRSSTQPSPSVTVAAASPRQGSTAGVRGGGSSSSEAASQQRRSTTRTQASSTAMMVQRASGSPAPSQHSSVKPRSPRRSSDARRSSAMADTPPGGRA